MKIQDKEAKQMTIKLTITADHAVHGKRIQKMIQLADSAYSTISAIEAIRDFYDYKICYEDTIQLIKQAIETGSAERINS